MQTLTILLMTAAARSVKNKLRKESSFRVGIYSICKYPFATSFAWVVEEVFAGLDALSAYMSSLSEGIGIFFNPLGISALKQLCGSFETCSESFNNENYQILYQNS